MSHSCHLCPLGVPERPNRAANIVSRGPRGRSDRWRELTAGGTSDEEATRLALAEFREGNLLAQYMAPLRQAQTTAPITPGAPAGHVLADVWQNVRYATRTLRKQRAFTVAAVLTLALGIGANTAMFSIVNAVLLQPLPYPAPSRVFVVHQQPTTRLSAENFLDLQRDARSFDALGAYVGTGFTLTDRGEPEFVMGQMISAELLDALDVSPLAGRPFRPDENEGGRDQVMLLSHGLWQRRYGADPAIVGRTITANGKPYTVIGVMPATFEFPEDTFELWVPFAFRNNAQGMVNRGTHFLRVAGRLRGGISVEQAQGELDAIARRLAQAYPT